MKEITFNSNTFDENITLYGNLFGCVNPKGIILIIHGMAEHKDRYSDFANFLANNGYLTVVYDQRGHGKTCGGTDKQGYMSDKDNFKAMVEDVKVVVDRLKEMYPNLDLHLFGHSMGSFISQRYIELYPNTIKSVILCGSNITSSALYGAGRVLAKGIVKKNGRQYKSEFLDKMSFGSYNKSFKPNRTTYDWLSVNEENVDKYIKDPYCGALFSCSYFMDLLFGFKDISDDYNKVPVELPINLIAGKFDPVGNMSKGVNKLYQVYLKNSVKDLNVKFYDGRHEILNEKNHQEVYDDVLNWVKNH